MKNKIFLITVLTSMMSLVSCSNFLDETPNKSGSAYIYHMDQLYGLMGSSDLYLFSYPSSAPYYMCGNYMNELIWVNDMIEISPEFYVYAWSASYSNLYEKYCWSTEGWSKQDEIYNTWMPAWERIYRFNIVLEYLDKVIQTTPSIHDQVKGEAYFGRAYYHFILLTEYCLWNEDEPGIGYRDATDVNGIPTRQTVAYTLKRIYADLDSAQVALTRAGRTAFDFEYNYRPTVPTVQALRARIALYRGDYDTALANATDALEAHNTLVAFKDDPLYALYPSTEIHFLDETDSHIASTITSLVMTDLENRQTEIIQEYKELFLPSVSCLESSAAQPISEEFYNLWDKENDARWIHFYNQYYPLLIANGILESVVLEGNNIPTSNCIKYEEQQYLKPWNLHDYKRFHCYGGADAILGMTTAEMYLIKAECEARAGNAAAAAEDLRTLRRTRFYDMVAAENIGGTIQEVLDERTREMGAFWRFYDIKRLNGAENANIHIRREILTDPSDINSRILLEIAPNDPRWAIPFYSQEVEMMGWAQNSGWDL